MIKQRLFNKSFRGIYKIAHMYDGRLFSGFFAVRPARSYALIDDAGNRYITLEIACVPSLIQMYALSDDIDIWTKYTFSYTTTYDMEDILENLLSAKFIHHEIKLKSFEQIL